MESYTDNTSMIHLSRKHEHMLLHESGIDPGARAERGTFTAWRGRDEPQDGAGSLLAAWCFERLL
jgi:hypothetical protein